MDRLLFFKTIDQTWFEQKKWQISNNYICQLQYLDQKNAGWNSIELLEP